ncbi:hypothetical protein TSAR_008097, partial [Trichomalopsis sarcophagae]
DNVVSNASNIHKPVKCDLSAIIIQVERLERGQVALKRARRDLDPRLAVSTSSPGIILNYDVNTAHPGHQVHREVLLSLYLCLATPKTPNQGVSTKNVETTLILPTLGTIKVLMRVLPSRYSCSATTKIP